MLILNLSGAASVLAQQPESSAGPAAGAAGPNDGHISDDDCELVEVDGPNKDTNTLTAVLCSVTCTQVTQTTRI